MKLKCTCPWGFVVVVALLQSLMPLHAESERDALFLKPPPTARPLTYWFWVNGNVTKEGIRADLEDMKRTGLGGGIIFDGSLYLPAGPLRYGTDAWYDHVQFAISTAAELELKIGLMICPGWATAGGPWNSLDQSMKFLVWSEQAVTAEGWSGPLPLPPRREDYYRDVAVLAVSDVAEESPATVTIEGSTVSFAFSRSIRLDTLLLPALPDATYQGSIEVSTDGTSFSPLTKFVQSTRNWLMPVSVSFPPGEGRFFRVIFKSKLGRSLLEGVKLSGGGRLPFPIAQAGLGVMPDEADRTATEAARAVDVIDLTDRLEPDGSLHWKAPPGRWKILRFGYTTTGATNHPAAEDATGWEVDKFDAAAVEHHLEQSVGPIIKAAGDQAGKALALLYGDSWEAGPQNWTAKMPELFAERRDYDLRKFLPCLTGRTVESREKSQAFLRDFRKTLGDLYAEKFFRTVARFANRSGLVSSAQGYGGNFDPFKVDAELDIPSVEFWVEGIHKAHGVATSVAHTTDKNVVMAEAFTSRAPDSRWTEVPSRLKPVGDAAFAAGVNLFTLHSYIHQPRSDIAPGFTHGRYGTHFGRLNSWWPLARGWIDYLQRCQFMLQTGNPVSDVLFVMPDQLKPEERDLDVAWAGSGLRGDYLAVSQIGSTRVENGLIKTRGHSTYRTMVMPGECRISLAQLRHLDKLRKEGAVIQGPLMPQPSGLLDVENPEWEREAAKWGDLAEVPMPWGVSPDFRDGEGLRFIHRTTPGFDLYFVANPHDHEVNAEMHFRITGRKAEFWDPLTGEIRSVEAVENKGETTVRHRFAASGSGFFVFTDKPSGRSTPVVAEAPQEIMKIDGEWRIGFQPGRGAPKEIRLSKLISWPEHADERVRYFSGVATYIKQIEVPAGIKGAVLDLGEVCDMAEVVVNGKPAGILWTAPFTVEIGHLLVAGENTLEIRVANRWINRLIGDEQLPPDAKYSGPEASPITRGVLLEFPDWWNKPAHRRDRVAFATWKHYDASEKLVPSGLLGPVSLRWTP